MDGLSLYAAGYELKPLIGGRIVKIQQPARDTVILTVRVASENHKLLLSAHPENGRAHLTQLHYPNPMEAPAFCMLLRKRLTGGRVVSVTQPHTDRILEIEIESRDELGDPTRQRLIIELMGRHSNIIFVNADGVILDCARHVNAVMSSVRLLLPGAAYIPAPTQQKLNPLLTDEAQVLHILGGAGDAHEALYKNLFGVSPHCARQLVIRWSGEYETKIETLREAEKQGLARYLFGTFQNLSKGIFTPAMVLDDKGEPVAYYAFPIAPAGNVVPIPTMRALLDAFYAGKDQADRIRRSGVSLSRILQNHLSRCHNKLAVYEQAANAGEDLEKLRLYGELLTANAYALSRGLKNARLMNYYLEPPQECVAPLDERLSPQENAQRYFKRYQKGKQAKEMARQQKEQTLAEIAYLEGQLDNLNKCRTDQEISEIRDELEQGGYTRPAP
ncbi:MAG: NFACT family protein, partial [Clostridiales bacterium]|nr:NFACT family protein [Clostridiales bacterium]